jgi:hypothetical protein
MIFIRNLNWENLSVMLIKDRLYLLKVPTGYSQKYPDRGLYIGRFIEQRYERDYTFDIPELHNDCIIYSGEIISEIDATNLIRLVYG